MIQAACSKLSHAMTACSGDVCSSVVGSLKYGQRMKDGKTVCHSNADSAHNASTGPIRSF